MTPLPAPTAEQQLEFLQRIQSLFEDGNFSATYKYALLMSLAELAVEQGADDGRELELKLIQIGEKFAELYWPQTLEYASGVAGATTAILKQNHGDQASVIRELLNVRAAGMNTLPQVKQASQWGTAVREITATVRQMPIQYLQNIGGTLVPFLYDYSAASRQLGAESRRRL